MQNHKLIATLALTAYLLAIPARAADQKSDQAEKALAESTPNDAAEPGACYDAAQVQQIALGLHELEVCQKTLALREKFIESAKLITTPETAWWQEPTVVVGGVVVSLSVGLAIGLLVAHGR